MLDVAPSNVFGLRVLWRDIGKSPVLFGTSQGCSDQVIDAGYGLASTAMTDQTGPPLLRVMELDEGPTRRIRYGYYGWGGSHCFDKILFASEITDQPSVENPEVLTLSHSPIS